MGKLLKHVRACDAVYASTISGFCQEAGIERENIVKYHNGGVFSPKYILLLDHKSQEIIVVVRGSASIMDFCTDLCLVNEPFQSGEGHRGMVHAAKWLANHLQDDLERLTAEYPEYQLITTGHSLGAAVAAIAAIALKQNFPRVHCYAFATPASVTRNLAEECYDYVTSVVAGDDCVPRLHQHSIYKLQGEVSKFDWRNTLKQMVTEEVAEQTTLVQKQKDEKLEQIYLAIRKFEELSIKQQNDALEKIDQVKRNITEFTSEIDRRVVKTIDSTLSPFRADKISLNHIKFIQDLLKADDKENVVPPLALLRDRINNVIVRATDSLKSEVKGTMSKVTETVSSNVQEYVETVKNEAEEISSRIQQEIDSAQKEIAESAETFAAKAQQIPSVETVVDSMFQDLKVLTQYYTADGGLREVGEEDHEELQEVDPDAEEEEEEAISMLEGEKALVASQEEAGGTDTLHHDPLFPPGRILYLNRVPLSEAQSSGLSSGSLEEVEMVEVGNDEFSRVVLSNKMILDHLCTTYERMLKSTKILASESSQEPQSVADIQAREFI
ncbi:Sn1-specific diacylglycerol lipase beta, partial [Globisporangium splendens]